MDTNTLPQKYKQYQKWFMIFLFLGIGGLVDIGSRQFINPDMGIVGLFIAYPLGWILGSDIAGIIWSLISLVFSFTIVYLILAFFFYRKMEKSKQ